ncbi:small lysine-rich protein 1 [Motacilla alba alba]|uniref:small lysine-rich protein 1 n=1 Tax=Motacilla alba alba TaxID=1094192 RepID=UPI0018D513A5|nr:small lysine-rich protein 1 [Motacilla alba alba]
MALEVLRACRANGDWVKALQALQCAGSSPWSLLQARKAAKPKGGKGKRSKKGTKKDVKEVDLFSPAAMLNAYYISHNAAAFLEFRGHPWPGSLKKKGKKKK